jgi:hypothetical protein
VLPSPNHCNIPASALLVSDDCIVVIDATIPAVHVALHHWQPNTPDGLGAPFLFHHGRNAINSSGGAISRMFKGSAGSAEDYHFPRAIAFAASPIQNSSAVVVTCDKEVITGKCFFAFLFFPFCETCSKVSISSIFKISLIFSTDPSRFLSTNIFPCTGFVSKM